MGTGLIEFRKGQSDLRLNNGFYGALFLCDVGLNDFTVVENLSCRALKCRKERMIFRPNPIKSRQPKFNCIQYLL